MLDMSFIMGFVGVAIGLMVGIMIFGAVEDAIDCPDATANPTGEEACSRATQVAWTVIGILPVTMFMALFTIFGGMRNLAFG